MAVNRYAATPRSQRSLQRPISFLETKINGCHRRWYGQTKEHKALIKAGKELPPWQSVNIRCHDLRVTYCTMCYEAGIPLKTLQSWMGHSDPSMILNIYAKLTSEKEEIDAATANDYINKLYPVNRTVGVLKNPTVRFTGYSLMNINS